MLVKAAEQYVALRRSVGFSLRFHGPVVLDYARYAETRGDKYVRIDTALEWAKRGVSRARKAYLLQRVRLFALHAAAEDPGHEIPPTDAFGPTYVGRPIPYIYTPDEIRSLVRAALKLRATWPLRPFTYAALISLLAATGLRVSEALGLKSGDITPDGLVIRMTKFRKSRLVPLHPTAQVGLEKFLARRSSLPGDSVFSSPFGRQLELATVNHAWRQIVRSFGLASPGKPRPRLHCLRHTFAVRALEACPPEPGVIKRHHVALAAYMGHVNIASTYWYLTATPELLRKMARDTEMFVLGGAR